MRLTDHGVDKIEENARGLNRHQPYPLARPTDTLLLVSLVRELHAEVAGYQKCKELWDKGMESTCELMDGLKQENRRLLALVEQQGKELEDLRRAIATLPGWYQDDVTDALAKLAGD